MEKWLSSGFQDFSGELPFGKVLADEGLNVSNEVQSSADKTTVLGRSSLLCPHHREQ